MKVPKDMRKAFESAYPDNKNLKACRWCEIYHCYRMEPLKGSKSDPVGVESIVASLLSSFMFKKAREAFEAIYKADPWIVWDPVSGYYCNEQSLEERETMGLIDRCEKLELFAVSYQEMFEEIYDQEVAI